MRLIDLEGDTNPVGREGSKAWALSVVCYCMVINNYIQNSKSIRNFIQTMIVNDPMSSQTRRQKSLCLRVLERTIFSILVAREIAAK